MDFIIAYDEVIHRKTLRKTVIRFTDSSSSIVATFVRLIQKILIDLKEIKKVKNTQTVTIYIYTCMTLLVCHFFHCTLKNLTLSALDIFTFFWNMNIFSCFYLMKCHLYIYFFCLNTLFTFIIFTAYLNSYIFVKCDVDFHETFFLDY